MPMYDNRIIMMVTIVISDEVAHICLGRVFIIVSAV